MTRVVAKSGAAGWLEQAKSAKDRDQTSHGQGQLVIEGNTTNMILWKKVLVSPLRYFDGCPIVCARITLS